MAEPSFPTLLVATWGEGVFSIRDGQVERELPGSLVTCLAPYGDGGALAVVDGTTLRRRSLDGRWSILGRGTGELACAVALGDAVFVGTNDARVMRLDAEGGFVPLDGFSKVPGRATWYAGTAIVDGRTVGPPLGVRSMCATSDASTWLVNVHVGGIPRSRDAGATWAPTIDVEWDAHQVAAHPSRPALVAAACAVGLAVSRDGGETWNVEHEGLHARHGLAVAFVGDEIWLSTATDPFTKEGAIYRRLVDGSEPLRRVDGGLDASVDTGGITARGDDVAVADKSGYVHLSRDRGVTWQVVAQGLPYSTGVLFVDVDENGWPLAEAIGPGHTRTTP